MGIQLTDFMPEELANQVEHCLSTGIMPDEHMRVLCEFADYTGGWAYLQALQFELDEVNTHLDKPLTCKVRQDQTGFMVDFSFGGQPLFYAGVGEVQEWIETDLSKRPVTERYVQDTLLALTKQALLQWGQAMAEILVRDIERIGVAMGVSVQAKMVWDNQKGTQVYVVTSHDRFTIAVEDFLPAGDPVERVLRVLSYFQTTYADIAM